MKSISSLFLNILSYHKKSLCDYLFNVNKIHIKLLFRLVKEMKMVLTNTPRVRPCLVSSQNLKFFKIICHIVSLNTCIKH